VAFRVTRLVPDDVTIIVTAQGSVIPGLSRNPNDRSYFGYWDKPSMTRLV
jgi:hypothetical protein